MQGLPKKYKPDGIMFSRETFCSSIPNFSALPHVITRVFPAGILRIHQEEGIGFPAAIAFPRYIESREKEPN
jgi:hypothetical protein